MFFLCLVIFNSELCAFKAKTVFIRLALYVIANWARGFCVQGETCKLHCCFCEPTPLLMPIFARAAMIASGLLTVRCFTLAF